MQTNHVRNRSAEYPAPPPRAALHERRLRMLCAMLDLAVTAILGLGVLACFALVVSML